MKERVIAIEALEKKATKSYNAIGNAGVVGAFQTDANNEKRHAFWWRLAAVGAFLLVGIGTIVELSMRGGELAWAETRSRIPVVIGLGAFAAFAIAESRSHRKAERDSRRREVELSSLDPFLVLIADGEQAEKVKLAYAKRIWVDQGVALDGQGEDE